MGKLITVTASSMLIVALAVPAHAASPQELPTLAERSARHDVTPHGDGPQVLRSATYTAKVFPISLRVSVPDGWRGGQGQSRQFKGTEPALGWIVLSQGTAAKAQGAITIVTAYGRTPSVGAVVAKLRSGGHGATYGPITPAKIAGFSGKQFDGTVDGQGHVFIPFSPRLHAATFYADAFAFDRGEVFRILTLDVRRKTIVVFLENAALPADRFPAFLTSASQIVSSLRFPG
jgi:hypothetical protein